jgi:hypothetical protein
MNGSIAWRIIGTCAVAGLIIAIAIPNLLESRKGSVSGAICALWTLHDAQEQYRAEHGRYATLGQLGDEGYIDRILAAAVEPAAAKSGYYFHLEIIAPDTWFCIARPSEWGISGERNFLITDKGEIYFNAEEDGDVFLKKAPENEWR